MTHATPMASFFRAIAYLAAAFILLVGAFLSFRHQGGIVFPDEKEYYALAENLVKYHMLTWDGVTPTASRPPGFVAWLAIGKFFGLGWGGLVWMNSLLVTLALWTLTRAWFSAEKLWAGRAAVLTLLFLYPVSLYVLSTLYPQALCLALLAFSFALLLGNGGIPAAMGAGALMGWCTLSAPMYLPWVGILALVPIFKRRVAGWPSAILFGLVAALLIGGWGVRNAVVMGKFVPFSTNSGYNLLIGNTENTRPNAGLNVDVSRYEAAAAGLNEVAADAYYSKAAKDWVLANPAAAVSMYVQKTLNYFNFRNELVTKSAGSPTRDALMFVTYYGLAALVLARMLLRWPAGRPEWKDWLVLAGYLACAMFTAVVVTRIRYRIPCDVMAFFVAAPVLAGFAEAALEKLRSLFRTESGA